MGMTSAERNYRYKIKKFGPVQLSLELEPDWDALLEQLAPNWSDNLFDDKVVAQIVAGKGYPYAGIQRRLGDGVYDSAKGESRTGDTTTPRVIRAKHFRKRFGVFAQLSN